MDDELIDFGAGVQVRIRKASDAPSVSSQGEQRRLGSAAPLASFESLGEESDIHSDVDDIFEEPTTPIATARPADVLYETLDDADSPNTPTPTNEVITAVASSAMETSTPGLVPYDDGEEVLNLNLQVAAPAEEETVTEDTMAAPEYQELPATAEDTLDTAVVITLGSGEETTYPVDDEDNDAGAKKAPVPPRPSRPPAPGKVKPPPPRPPPPKSPQPEGEETELAALCGTPPTKSYVERKYGSLVPEVSSTERPRSTTPINLATLDDYVATNTQETEQQSEGMAVAAPSKIVISLPGKEFNRAKSPKKTAAEKSYVNFEDGPLFSQSAMLNVDEEEDAEGSKQKRVLMPRNSPKRPAPPPPSKKVAPPRPQILPAKTNWENFDVPTLNPPPPVSKDRGGPGEDPCGPDINGNTGESLNMSSFDDESTLWDPTSPTEKEKPKSKLGRSPKRMVRGLVEVSPKKSPKKDKKDKKDKSKNKNHDDLEKFIPYEDRNDEKSEEWLEFEAMQARIKANVAKTQERLSRLGSSGEKLISAGNGDNDNAACGNVNSAWIAFDENGEPVNNVFDNDKAEGGWQGFDDDFNGGSKTSKSQLGVSPGASPRHTPVPPNNSRRQSIEDKSDVDKGRETEADLLGLMADSSNTGQTQSAPTSSLNTDLLGLDGMSGAEQISGDVDMLGGISLLSRNPPASNMSSTAPSPAPGRRDLFDDLKGEGSDTEQTSSGAMQLVDDFLGITAAVDTSSNKEPSLPTQTDAEVPQTKLGADIFNIDSRTPENLDTVDDDDFLGLGIQTKRTSSSTNVIPGGNLMEGFEDETKDDTEQAPATLTEPKAPSPIPSPNRSRPRPKGKAVVDLSSIVQKLSGPQEQETTSVPTKPTDIVPDLFGTDDAVTVTVEQPQTEAKPLDEDLFGLGPSADGDVGEGELTQPPGDPFDILAQTSDTNPFTKSDTEVPTKATPDVLEVFLGGSAEKAETPMSDDFDPRGDFKLSSRPPADSGVADVWGDSAAGSSEFEADFTAVPEGAASKNPFADFDGQQGAAGASVNPFEVSGTAQPELFGVDGPINPFATVTKDAPGPEDPDFDPFATITEDDQAFEASITAGRPSSGSPSSDREDGEPKSPRINPFNKEPPLDDKFANFEAQVKKESESASPPQLPSVQSSVDDEPEDLEPSEPFYPEYTGDGWKLLLRMPLKKKFTGNRFWKPVYIRICKQGDNNFVLKIFHNEKDSEAFHELALQASYNMCNMGLQQFDQFGKCHTVKIQYVFYRETVGMKTERITPTLNDLMRVRNIKGLKDLVHKPKTTMILDHAPQASELLKIGGLSLEDFRIFVRELENAFFHMKVHREKTLTYTKDEMTMDVVDEYYAEIDKFGHIVDHKNRVRVFCLAFLTGMPLCELGLNDKRRRGKEIVGRHDIIPIKTEEWIRIETPEFHCTVDSEDYEKSKLVKFKPLDGAQFELLRFRTRPKANKELPLQIRSQMSVLDKHVEIRADVMIPGYFSNSRRAAQVPCEDIEICFPVPEQWIYLFRVEKRFRYGSIKAATRKPGKIKGLERLTMIAQGILPPSLIEVSAGTAKYENVYKGIVWRISRLPERNEGAYKTHLFVCKLDLGPHDVVPDTYEQHVKVTFSMPNSTVSRAQVRSISVDNPDPPDKWVHHLAKYEYKVEIEFTDQLAKFQESDLVVTSPKSPLATEPQDGMPEEEPDQPPEGAVAKLIDADDSDSSFDSD